MHGVALTRFDSSVVSVHRQENDDTPRAPRRDNRDPRRTHEDGTLRDSPGVHAAMDTQARIDHQRAHALSAQNAQGPKSLQGRLLGGNLNPAFSSYIKSKTINKSINKYTRT